jgi:hypothetical protein
MLLHQQLPLELLLVPQVLALLLLRLLEVDQQSCSPRPVHVATRQHCQQLEQLQVPQVLALLLLLMMLIMMRRNDRRKIRRLIPDHREGANVRLEERKTQLLEIIGLFLTLFFCSDNASLKPFVRKLGEALVPARSNRSSALRGR